MATLLVVAVALLIGACSTVRLAYDHLGFIARHEVGEFVDLDDAQKQQFDASFDRLWLANRRDALPQYARALRQLAAEADQPVTLEGLKQWSGRLDEFATALGRDAARAFAPLVASLTDAQVAELLARIDRRDEKRMRKEHRRDAGEKRSHEQDDIETQLKKWTDDEKPAQHQLIVAWLIAKPADEDAQLDALDRGWRRSLEQLLARRRSPGFAVEMERFITDPHFPEFDAAQPRYQRERDRGLQLWVDLSRTFSADQRRYLSAKMIGYADDFDALAVEKIF